MRARFLVSILVSLFLVGLGVLANDPLQIFRNAVVVCLSCIGIQ